MDDPLFYQLIRHPYRIVWRILRRLGRTSGAVVYCAEPMDYIVLKPVLVHLDPLPFVVRNSRTRRFLLSLGFRVHRWPVFPRAVITCRHAAALFPEPKIVKIGFRHGAYHFKKFTRSGRYNAFDLYFVTSRHEEEEARAAGIRSARSGGFPKLDPAFDGSWSPEFLSGFKSKTGADPGKKTVLLTATYPRSGLSALDQWEGSLGILAETYNVWVTLHPWTPKRRREAIRRMPSVFLIEDLDVLPYIGMADVLVGDASSILAEGCALDKPLITFEVPPAKRTSEDAAAILKRISIRIRSADELGPAIQSCIDDPGALAGARRRANRIFFDRLDGRSGARCAKIIRGRIGTQS